MFTAHASHALLQFFNGSLSSSYSNFQIYIEGYGNGGSLDVVFRQIEIVLKDSTAFVYVTKSEKSSHFTLMT